MTQTSVTQGTPQIQTSAVYKGPVCKGCWSLGNNCKICEKCIATKPSDIHQEQRSAEAVAWMPIESAPRDGTLIDLWLDANGEKPARRVTDCFWDKDAGHWRQKGNSFHFGQKAFPQVLLAWMPLPPPPGTTPPASEVEVLREALVDDPNWIAAGIPDAAIEAGIAAWDQCNHDLENYVSGKTPDWDEGMIVAAIFKAVARTALESRHDT